MAQIYFDQSFAAWRNQARTCILAGLQPCDVEWFADNTAPTLFDDIPTLELSNPPSTSTEAISIPAAYLKIAQTVAAHRDSQRWSLLYRVLWRLLHGERQLLQLSADDDVRRLQLMAKQVSRDIHKMHAFVRFKKISLDDGSDHYVAWHQPDHFIVELAAPFFMRRFRAMRWTIMTPDKSAQWDGSELRYHHGVSAAEFGTISDSVEQLWLQYYSSTFNPARLKIKMMKQEMPVRYWQALPEAKLIPELIQKSYERTNKMLSEYASPLSAKHYFPQRITFDDLKYAVQGCRACNQCEGATQAVWGNGNLSARIILVGEQPGDQEDLSGEPFVGPAGQLLKQALTVAGIALEEVYLTNAVKHFRFRREGAQRIHMAPSKTAIGACQPWLIAELNLLKPDVIILLGATAAQSILGRLVNIEQERGKSYPTTWTRNTFVTAHPSAVLRIKDPSIRDIAFAKLVADLKLALVPRLANPTLFKE